MVPNGLREKNCPSVSSLGGRPAMWQRRKRKTASQKQREQKTAGERGSDGQVKTLKER